MNESMLGRPRQRVNSPKTKTKSNNKNEILSNRNLSKYALGRKVAFLLLLTSFIP